MNIPPQLFCLEIVENLVFLSHKHFENSCVEKQTTVVQKDVSQPEIAN